VPRAEKLVNRGRGGVEVALRYDCVAAVHALGLVPVSFIANDPEIFATISTIASARRRSRCRRPARDARTFPFLIEEIRVDTGCDLAIEGETRERSPDVGGAIAAAAHLVTT
jgi:hypothetical protein